MELSTKRWMNYLQNMELGNESGEGTSSFLLTDTGPTDPNRIIVFGNPSTVPRLAFVEQLHLDGTFWVTPKNLFYQMVTIHAMVYGQMFPVFYVLINGKSEALYERMFHEIFQILARFGIHQLPYLRTVVSDFESGLMSTVDKVFPGVTHRGCYFHFCQAVYRKVIKLGFKSDYENDDKFRESVRALLALGHVPAEWKQNYYGYVFGHYAHDTRFVKWAQEYFYPFWFG